MSEYFYDLDEKDTTQSNLFKTTFNDVHKSMRAMDFTFLPPRAVSVAMQDFRERSVEKSVLTWGVPKIDERVIPLRRTSYTAIIGRPGMGKSYEMMRLATHHASQLKAANPAKPPLVMYATWETSVEEFIGIYSSKYTGVTLSDIARGVVDLSKIQDGLVAVMGDNFVVFGVSHISSRQRGVIPTQPTVQDMYRGVEYLESMGHKIGIIYADYAQAIPDEKGRLSMSDVTARVSANIVDIKSIFCVSCGIPVVAGIQARRDVDDYGGLKLPRMSDGQHTSVIEQAFDNVFAVTMPAKYMPLGGDFAVKDAKGQAWAYEVTGNTRVIAMLKQRYEAADQSDVWPILFNPFTLEAMSQDTLGEILGDKEGTDLGTVV